MDPEEFGKRLTQLRNARHISGRDMSLSIGQCASYINKIENGKAFPSMQAFFYICEFLDITPKEFFDDGLAYPDLVHSFVSDLNSLNPDQVASIYELVRGLKK